MLTANIYVKRFPMSELPTDHEEGAKFLRDLYVEKDKLVDNFFTTGTFFEKDADMSNIQRIELTRHVNILFAFVLTQLYGYVMFYAGVKYIVMSGGSFSIFATIGSLVVGK